MSREPRAARDVKPGECWAFRDHPTMADVIAAEIIQRRIDKIVRRWSTRPAAAGTGSQGSTAQET